MKRLRVWLSPLIRRYFGYEPEEAVKRNRKITEDTLHTLGLLEGVREILEDISQEDNNVSTTRQ